MGAQIVNTTTKSLSYVLIVRGDVIAIFLRTQVRIHASREGVMAGLSVTRVLER